MSRGINLALAVVLALTSVGWVGWLAAGEGRAPRGTAATSGPTPSGPLPTRKPDPGPGHNDSITDGCQRNPGALLLDYSPEWAPVYNHSVPANQPMPATWVTGTVSSGAADRTPTHPSGGDLPAAHYGHDINVNILPDPQFDYLVAGHPATDPAQRTGNYAGDDDGTARLHTEWEGLSIPPYAWADIGDRVTQLGTWAWDCGHWGTPTEISNVVNYDLHLLPDQECIPNPAENPDPQCTPTGEQTEFHPYRVTWIQRAAPSRAAQGESEAELFVSTDGTLSGVIDACAHSTPPPTPPTPVSPYTTCLQTHSLWQDVSGDYSFFLPAPPRTSPTARLTARAVKRDSVGAPEPTLTPTATGVVVTFHLATSQDQRLVMGYSVFAGWSEVAATALPTHLQVHFDLPEDNLAINRSMEPNCFISNSLPVFTPQCESESTRYFQQPNPGHPPPSSWTMYYDVGSTWGNFQWGGTTCQAPLSTSVPPYAPEFCPVEGAVLHGKQSVDLYVPPGKGWRFLVVSRECDTGGLPGGPWHDCPSNHSLGDNEDVPGEVLDIFPSAAASLGIHHANGRTACPGGAAPCGTSADTHDHDSTCPGQLPDGRPTNPMGCYTLTYTVAQVNDIASRTTPGTHLPNTRQDPPVPRLMVIALAVAALLLGAFRQRVSRLRPRDPRGHQPPR